MPRERMDTYEVEQPWVLYHYGITQDGFWPPWNSSRVLGRFKIIFECMVCGDRTVDWIRVPRFGKVPDRGYHPKRSAYLKAHAHPDRGAPMSWAMPLANLYAHPGGLNVDALAMRLEADLNETQSDGEA